jgi:hypothetical protein
MSETNVIGMYSTFVRHLANLHNHTQLQDRDCTANEFSRSRYM